VATCLVPLLAAGCFVPVGYGYPTLSVTPPVDVGKQADEVHVFRIDIADVSGCLEFGSGPDRYVFHPVHLTDSGRGLPQVGVALDYGWVWNCIALIFDKHTSHTVRVRAYRPGYQTVEIRSWQTTGKVSWEEAPDLAARERAVDALLSTWETDSCAFRPHRGKNDFLCQDSFFSLAPGSAAPGHRRALLFAAAEYERLGSAADGVQRTRLSDKAQSLRELADQ
jgi:hypothetical protein